MTYALGMDVGTTFTAAGVWRDGVVEAVGLGNRSHVVPSVVFATDGGPLLVGEPAVRRAVLQPGRVAREFKRNVGDRVPVRLGGRSFRAEELMVEVARWVLDRVAEREGGPAAALTLTVPATWGSYRQRLLEEAVAELGLATAPRLLEEPVAAALHYASQERIPTEAVVAVYDLGGGTFDATVLRKTESGFELAGPAQGDDRLGGLDLDQVVLDHIAATLGSTWTQLDPLDPATVRSVAMVRAQAADAKEALSADVEVAIPIVLPGGAHEVRLTRGEFESAIEGPLLRSVETLERAVTAAGIAAEDLHGVLLVGGSSRIPLVSQLIVEHLGARVALDAHPKFAVCLGAAVVAGNLLDPAATPVLRPAPRREAPDRAALLAEPATGDPEDARVPTTTADNEEPDGATDDHRNAPTTAIPVVPPPDSVAGSTAAATTPVPTPTTDDDDATTQIPPTTGTRPMALAGDADPAPTTGRGGAGERTLGPPTAPPPDTPDGRRIPTVPLVAAAVLVLVAAVVLWPDGGDDGPAGDATPIASSTQDTSATTSPTTSPTTPPTTSPTASPTPTGTPTTTPTPATAPTPTLPEVLETVGPVAWVLATDDGPVVQVRTTAQGEPVDIVGPGGDGRQPAISPDGSRVAFVSGGPGAEQVVVADIDGSGSPEPIPGLPTPSFEPAWSPDGDRIAVTTLGDNGRVVAVLDLGTGELTEVTDGAVFDQRPAWSPSGDRLAFHRIVQGNADVFVVPTDGSAEPTPVAATSAAESHPSWSPDGTRIAYSSLDDGVPAVFVADIADGTTGRLWPALFEGQAAPVWTSADIVVYEAGDRAAENILAGHVDGSWVVDVQTGPAATNDPGLTAGR